MLALNRAIGSCNFCRLLQRAMPSTSDRPHRLVTIRNNRRQKSVSFIHNSTTLAHRAGITGSEDENTGTKNILEREIAYMKKPKSLKHKWKVLELDDVVEFLREENASDIAVLEIPKEMCYVDYFVIATAMSPRHLGSMAEMINKLYKRTKKADQPFTVIEGKRVCDDWQCVDIGNMVVHLMLEETREEFQLEKLWLLGPQHDDLLLEKPSESEILKRIASQGLNLMSMDEDTVAALGNFGGINPWDNEDELEPSELSREKVIKPAKDDALGDDDAFLV